MNQNQDNFEGGKTKIVIQIAELSRLLGMIPSEDTSIFREPMTQNNMVLSEWLSVTRASFQKLALLISRELDIQLQ